MKLIDVRLDTPANNNPYSKISIPIGDILIKDVHNGGYNAQHVPLLNLPVTDTIIKIYGNGIIAIHILFILGYTTSRAPKNIGVK